ncbi:O-antigen ligase [Flavobacterium sp. SORGH_AS_0622]|uniref:O-antigen ligase family protein n=1 Tax=Flavobacterium sp. SORGH_AS_0622 TaxID=3041772 RepID=UPI002786AB86|nr:O-antigen ligase family protein [Flavobacterium sp. SORGH_AS_0622]MDQ1168099.1 O-antigen ligase [Flavobacterium sp. SORGH_AS_0622]
MKINKIDLYNYSTIFLGSFPILGLKKSVLAIILWAVFSLILMISEKSYKTIQKRDKINLLVLTSYYLAFVVSFLFIEDKKLATRFLEKNVAFLIFPLFIIVNKNFIYGNTLRKSINIFIISNIILASYIWIVILSNGYEKVMNSDTYYNPIIRNFFSDISEIHLPYLGILFVFSSLVLLNDILSNRIKFNYVFIFRSLGIALLIFSVITYAARLALVLFLVLSIFLVLKKTPKVWIKIGFMIFLASSVFLIFVIPSSKKRIDEIRNTKLILPNQDQKSEEVNFRYGIYNCVSIILKENWILGVGPGNVQKKLDNCYSSYTYKNYDDYSKIEYNSHNQYLDIWLKYGIFGLILFLVFLLWGTKNIDLLYGIFIFIIMAAMLTENIFDRQVGVVFFTFFNSLFLINRIDHFEKSPN